MFGYTISETSKQSLGMGNKLSSLVYIVSCGKVHNIKLSVKFIWEKCRHYSLRESISDTSEKLLRKWEESQDYI